MRQEKSVPLKSPTHQEYMLYLLKRYFSDFEIECFFFEIYTITNDERRSTSTALHFLVHVETLMDVII